MRMERERIKTEEIRELRNVLLQSKPDSRGIHSFTSTMVLTSTIIECCLEIIIEPSSFRCITILTHKVLNFGIAS